MTLNNKKTVDSSEWIMKYTTESSPYVPGEKRKKDEKEEWNTWKEDFFSSLFPFIFIKRIV